MASSITCPSCGDRINSAGSGGPVRCPRCGKTFRPPSPGGSSRPVLLDRLPGTFFGSAGFIAVASVGIFLYGGFLYAVLSNRRPEPIPADPPALAQAETPSPAPAATATTPRPASPSPTTASPSPTTPAPAPAAPPKDDTPPAATPPAATPIPAPPATAAEPHAPTPAPSPSPERPGAPAAPPKEGSATPPTRSRVALGPLIDPEKDCKLSETDAGLSIAIPGGLYILSPELNLRNAPSALTDVVGDFTLTVKVPGEIKPGPKAVNKLPFTYQGAGLLLFGNADNFVRLERGVTTKLSSHTTIHQIVVEVCQNGKPVGHTYRDFPDGPTHLRLERRGSDLICSASSDGQSWDAISKLPVKPNDKVAVGVSATNVSQRSLLARFEGLSLVPGPAPR